MATVLIPTLASLEGYGFLLGAALGGVVYWVLMRPYAVDPHTI
nr:hypothetical protein [uncultured Psychrobacter sp.]